MVVWNRGQASLCDTVLGEMRTNVYSHQIGKSQQTKAKFGEPLSFIGTAYRNVGEGLFTVAQRQLHDQMLSSAWVTSWKLEALNALYNLEAAQQAGGYHSQVTRST